MSESANNQRRDFIKKTAKAGLAISTVAFIPESLFACTPAAHIATVNPFKTGFDQTPLPYNYNSLEPIIDATTMEIHYSKHAATYSKNLKEAALAEKIDMSKSLEDILPKISTYSAKMRNNAGGHYNHELFWKTMKPGVESKPSSSIVKALEKDFNSLESFKTQFSDAAKTRFGSGWAWLFLTPDKIMKIGSTPNQDNPLMDVSEIKGLPLMGLDVWEHAYYLKYQNRRPEYVENWWKLIDWEFVQKRYEASL